MGGYGSGRWNWHSKKSVVEDCLALSISEVVGHVLPRLVFDKRINWAGSIIWRRVRTGEIASSMGYQLLFDDDSARLVLDYKSTFRDGTERFWNYPVRLVITPCNYGGVRWWFECPDCGRRVGKLYIPPQSGQFACRRCYSLTYTSAQEAHKYDRSGSSLMRMMGALGKLIDLERDLESGKRWGKRRRKQFEKYMGAGEELNARLNEMKREKPDN